MIGLLDIIGGAVLALFGAGLLIEKGGVMAWLGWLIIAFICGLASFLTWKRVSGKKTARTALSDGESTAAEVTASEKGISVIRPDTQEVKTLAWADISEVSVIAIDAMPIGGISWVLRAGDEVIEVPWEAEGGPELLSRMQSRLTGFDDKAVVEMAGRLQGYKRVWPAANEKTGV